LLGENFNSVFFTTFTPATGYPVDQERVLELCPREQNASGLKVDTHHNLQAKLIMCALYIYSVIRFHGVVLKHKNIFTF
jgi:hypothetical protein